MGDVPIPYENGYGQAEGRVPVSLGLGRITLTVQVVERVDLLAGCARAGLRAACGAMVVLGLVLEGHHGLVSGDRVVSSRGCG